MFISKGDSINVLKLSTRAYNALYRSRIYTIDDLLSYAPDDFINIRNLGVKTLSKITDCLESIKSNELILRDKYLDQILPEVAKTFIYKDGNRYIDYEIEKLQLSIKTYNCLKKEGFSYFSEIAFKNENNLLDIPNMGEESICEILQLIKNTTLKPLVANERNENYNSECLCNSIYNSLNQKLNLNTAEHYENIIKYLNYFLKKNNLNVDSSIHMMNKELQKILQQNPYIRGKYESFLIKLIGENPYGCYEEYIYEQTPTLLKESDFIFNSLLSLIQEEKIIEDDDRYIVNYPSFIDGAISVLSEREYDIFIKRTQDLTLEEIGISLNITRERVRQIESKVIKRLNKSKTIFKEDIYSNIYKNYYISTDEFRIAFKNIQTYFYLALRYDIPRGSTKNRKSPLIDVLLNEMIPDKLKKQIEKAIYKDYVKIGKEYIPCTRHDITNYILRTFATDDISFSDFTEVYFTILDDLGKSDDEKLSLMDRGYENKLAASSNVLWKYGKKIRYYNINNYDFEELLLVLNFSQYSNVEYSTLKFFKLYPILMKDYDIRDEYELHNLLKKICNKEDYPYISFGRMPNIVFGIADRDSQVLELLISLAPISNYDFAAEYEKEYGVSSATVLANYMKNFDEYFHDGIYKIDTPMLPYIIATKLKTILTADFYSIDEMKKIYKKEFPNADLTLLNPFSIKNLGFKVYSSYVISDKFNSATEYLNHLLTKNDVVDTSLFSPSIKQTIAYISHLHKLKSDYDIIEFSIGKYISFNKLHQNGVTKDILNNFVSDVLVFVGEGKYFTMHSLIKKGFSHILDEFGFDYWFYASLLVEHKNEISYFRIGGNKVFLKGKSNITFEDFIEDIVFCQENFLIDIYELVETLKQYYNIHIPIYKLIATIRNSGMFYDEISEKVYADYDIYYEEI